MKASYSQEEKAVFQEFERRLNTHGVTIDSVDETGLIFIKHNDIDFKISLDNAIKNYRTDGDFDLLNNLIKTITNIDRNAPSDKWSEVKNKLYRTLFPSDFDDFGTTICNQVTDQFYEVCVYYEASKITWVDSNHLKKWKISEKTLWKQVNNNMGTVLSNTVVHTEEFEGHRMGWFDTDFVFKSSLLLNRNIGKLKKEFGSPIYCVIPNRDFCYFFSEKDKDFFLKRLQEVVLEEYNSSEYPVSTEVLKLSKKYIEVIGEFRNE